MIKLSYGGVFESADNDNASHLSVSFQFLSIDAGTNL